MFDRPYEESDPDCPFRIKKKESIRHNQHIWPFIVFAEVESRFRVGQYDLALQLIRNCWGQMLSKGPGTFWEWMTKDGDIPELFTSLCHGWSGGPAYSLQAHLLGIKPILPGFQEFEVKPFLGKLDYIEGAVPTPQGPIEIIVRHDKKRVNVKLSAPRALKGFLNLKEFDAFQPQVEIEGNIERASR